MAEPASGGAASSSAAPSLSTATVSLPFIHWVCGVDPATLQAAIASLATVEAAAAPLAAALTAAYASVLDLTEQQAAFRLETLREVVNAPTTSMMEQEYAALHTPLRELRAQLCNINMRGAWAFQSIVPDVDGAALAAAGVRVSIADVAAALGVDAAMLQDGFASVLAGVTAAAPLAASLVEAYADVFDRSAADGASDLRALQLLGSRPVADGRKHSTLERKYADLFQPLRALRNALAATLLGSIQWAMVRQDSWTMELVNSDTAVCGELTRAGANAVAASGGGTSVSAASGSDRVADDDAGPATVAAAASVTVDVRVIHAAGWCRPTPLTLALRESATWGEVQQALVAATGIPVDRQFLAHVSTSRNAAQPAVQAVLHELPTPGVFAVGVEMGSGNVAMLRVRLHTKAGSVIAAICAKTGIDPATLRLQFCGERVGYDASMADLGICPHDVFNMFAQMVGD